MLSIVEEEPTIAEDERLFRVPDLNRDIKHLMTKETQKKSFVRSIRRKFRVNSNQKSIFDLSRSDSSVLSKSSQGSPVKINLKELNIGENKVNKDIKNNRASLYPNKRSRALSPMSKTQFFNKRKACKNIRNCRSPQPERNADIRKKNTDVNIPEIFHRGQARAVSRVNFSEKVIPQLKITHDTDKSESTKDMSEASPTFKQERKRRAKNQSIHLMKNCVYLEPLGKPKKSFSPKKAKRIHLEDNFTRAYLKRF